ncbi:hypothetical protein Riv7116_4690 [Rivularia sp. PCC 7116]|uniref:hypothetical protein n=1 Tax=Rivularia sp. PCC 7116 TaxID=373994 RepID=UPI00029ED1AB|nr:hypothetical protein [Rivularia sp. PCC 7116]AFY57107.1 hypothetical protein Riv7116_4690 [Rivularia sp. PCC 7116]
MNEKPQQNNKSNQNLCHICGSQEFISGRSVGNQNDWLYFRSEGGFWGDGEKLSARKCSQCKNVQLFTDVD